MEKDQSLFVEISNPTRLSILLLLKSSPHSLKDLASKIDLSKPEISRQLSRLVDVGLITKPSSIQKYELTHLGVIILKLYSPIMFIVKFHKYFQTHQLQLPNELLIDLCLLTDAVYLDSLGKSMMKIDEVLKRGKKKSV